MASGDMSVAKRSYPCSKRTIESLPSPHPISKILSLLM